MSTATEPTEVFEPDAKELAAESPKPTTSFEKAFEVALKGETAKEPEAEAPPAKQEPTKADKPGRAPDALFKKPDEEAKPEEAETTTEAKPGAKQSWAELRGKAERAEKELAKIRQEKEVLEKGATVEELTKLREQLAGIEKERNEMSELLGRAKAELHPEFQSKYIKGRESLVKRAADIADESGGDRDAVIRALNLSGKERVDALRDIAADMDNFQSGRLGRLIDEINNLDEERAAKLSNSGQYAEELQRLEQEKARQSEEQMGRVLEKSFLSASKSLEAELEVLRKVDGADWWNEQGEAIVKKAREFFNGNTDATAAAAAAIKAEAAGVYRELYVKEREFSSEQEKRVQELEKELEGIYSRTPGVRSGAAGKKPGGKPGFYDQLKEMGFED
jgi:hypothetical protein